MNNMTIEPMTAEQLAVYRETAHRRYLEAIERRADRRARAWSVATLGASILRECFGASAVLVFGSLAGGEWFAETSDIDLAAAGMRAEDYFTAVAAMQGLSSEFEVDLVDLDRCPSGLRESVLREGISL